MVQQFFGPRLIFLKDHDLFYLIVLVQAELNLDDVKGWCGLNTYVYMSNYFGTKNIM